MADTTQDVRRVPESGTHARSEGNWGVLGWLIVALGLPAAVLIFAGGRLPDRRQLARMPLSAGGKRIGFVADSRGTVAELRLSDAVSAAYDIMVADRVPRGTAAAMAVAAERQGRDPVAFAEHFVRVRKSLRTGDLCRKQHPPSPARAAGQSRIIRTISRPGTAGDAIGGPVTRKSQRGISAIRARKESAREDFLPRFT